MIMFFMFCCDSESDRAELHDALLRLVMRCTEYRHNINVIC